MIKLSQIINFKSMDLEQIINYCLDNNISTIINDFSPYNIEYELCDLSVKITSSLTVWDNLRSI